MPEGRPVPSGTAQSRTSPAHKPPPCFCSTEEQKGVPSPVVCPPAYGGSQSCGHWERSRKWLPSLRGEKPAEMAHNAGFVASLAPGTSEIGRASCRERV